VIFTRYVQRVAALSFANTSRASRTRLNSRGVFVANIADAVRQLDRIADSLVGNGEIIIPATTCVLGATGAPLAVFADNAGASAPGIQINNSETFVVRWNNFATQSTVAFSVGLPSDLDTAYNITVAFEVWKTGATSGDATTVTFTAFVVKAGQLNNADADCGGATTAVTATATAQTIQTVSRDIASSDLVASLGTGGPGTLSIAFKPTDGTLGTDDFCCSKVTITYRRRAT
jgi:hypothetical protein